MLEGKLIIIPALRHQNKGNSSFTGSGLLVLMSQCGNNNELALQHGGLCTTCSLVAKGLLCQCILRAPPSQAEHLAQQKLTHRYYHLLTIQPPMVTDITTY